MRILLGGIAPTDTEIYHALPQGATLFTAATSTEMVESVYACAPDVLLVAHALQGAFGALQQISAVLPVPVILIGQPEDEELTPSSLTMDVFGYLVRPIQPLALRQMLTVASVQFQRLQHAREESAQLREAFASRKIIERAKGLLMQHQQLNEAQAYCYLREESRRQRIPIFDLAKSLLGDADDAPVKKVQVRRKKS